MLYCISGLPHERRLIVEPTSGKPFQVMRSTFGQIPLKGVRAGLASQGLELIGLHGEISSYAVENVECLKLAEEQTPAKSSPSNVTVMRVSVLKKGDSQHHCTLVPLNEGGLYFGPL